MQKKVLLVNQQGSEVGKLIRLEGYLVDEAKSVQKALKAILDGNYALVISDLSVAGLETRQREGVLSRHTGCLNIGRTHIDAQ